jgi:bifunctional NMN adenylyltransferase/nudix hydrolase
MSQITVGIIPGRFQVADFHEGHKFLIDSVLRRRERVIIFLGVNRTNLAKENPLNFEARKAMIQGAYPNIEVYPIRDSKSDIIWSKNLDGFIAELCKDSSVLLYGGEDSFKNNYFGKHSVVVVDHVVRERGKELRAAIAKEIIDSVDWRKGYIFGVTNRYDIVSPTVDIVVYDDKNNFLLGRKHEEEKWRFIGGFIDPSDASAEAAAKRELSEEAGISLEVDYLEYVGSCKIKDWRMSSGSDGIMTTFFKAKKIFGRAEGGDDLAEVKWVTEDDLVEEIFEPEHIALLTLLKQNLRRTKMQTSISFETLSSPKASLLQGHVPLIKPQTEPNSNSQIIA